MTVKTYIITANDVTPARMSDLASRLGQAGFKVTQQLDAVGVIAGAAEEALIPQIRALAGVAAIEEERSYQLPSSDGDPS